MKKALVVVSVKGAKHLIGAALAKRISTIKDRRIYIAYGSTNEVLLEHLDIQVKNYYSGFLGKTLKTNKDKSEVVILNRDEDTFMDEMNTSDIFIKGANALCMNNGSYEVAVAAASSVGGTFGRVYVQASCVGAEIIIPIGHEKLVPSIEKNISQGDFDRVMGRSIALLPMFGEVFTEINAFKALFNLSSTVLISGGINGSEGSLCFSLEGDINAIESAIIFLENHN
jgi:hypothetical protein